MTFLDLGLSCPKRITTSTALVLLAVTAAGWAGNYLGYEVFFSVYFIFGSIFAMLVLQLFGQGWGILAGSVISSSTWLTCRPRLPG